MRRLGGLLLGLTLAGTAGAAAAQHVHGPAPATSKPQAAGHDMAVAHHTRTFSFLRADVDAVLGDEGELGWDVDGWRGGDRNKLWLKSEGEIADGDLEEGEIQLLYSRNVATYFDAQVGVRYDVEPESTAYLVAGVQGLAPYQFETDAAAFLSQEGDLSFRLEQGLDLLLTQRLVLEPEIELELFARDVAEQDVGAGLSEAELSLRLRYEITRKFVPYAEVAYRRRLGETALLARARGDDPAETLVRAGLRVWF